MRDTSSVYLVIGIELELTYKRVVTGIDLSYDSAGNKITKEKSHMQAFYKGEEFNREDVSKKLSEASNEDVCEVIDVDGEYVVGCVIGEIDKNECYEIPTFDFTATKHTLEKCGFNEEVKIMVVHIYG